MFMEKMLEKQQNAQKIKIHSIISTPKDKTQLMSPFHVYFSRPFTHQHVYFVSKELY